MSLAASPAPFPGFHCVQSGLPKGEAERRETHVLTRAAQRAPLRGALAFRRPTAALARETAGPQGSASGHASGDSPGRLILYGRPNRGAETLRFSAGITRAALISVQRAPRTPVIVPAR